MITANGGNGKKAPVGGIRTGREAASGERKITPWYIFPGTMPWLTANGQASACQPKPNGNGQPAAVYKTKYIPGAMNLWNKANPKPTPGKAISPTITPCGTNITAW